MSDIFTKEKRSEIMSNISGKETKPEILVRKFLFANGFRYRKNDKRYPGKPDIVLPKYKTIILVHGCFWHGHSCPTGKLSETRKDFWTKKINGNIERDRRNIIELKKLGWKVITIWQCELKNNKIQEKTLEELKNTLLLIASSLFFKEPKNINTLFSEYDNLENPINEISENEYKIPYPTNGYLGKYKYKNGILERTTIHHVYFN